VEAAEKLYAWVKDRLEARDSKAVKTYLKKREKVKLDVRVVFEPGMQVLLKAKLPWKNKCRSTGPYTFVEYEGRRGTNAVIETYEGKRYYVSTANLIPIYSVPPSEVRMERFNTQPGRVPNSPQNSSTSDVDSG
jgi:hypothetical protein